MDPTLSSPGLEVGQVAPEWTVERWFGSDRDLTLAGLRGQVVVLEVFQMLCPGCVSHGLPQARRVRGTFDSQEVVVLGLHSVFEHHAAMAPEHLEAFLFEYRVDFPIGVDAPGAGRLPVTMQRYGLEGTPTLLLFDRRGVLQARHFGQVSDMRLGAEISGLVLEAP